MRCVAYEPHGIADADAARADHLGVERELAAEALDDVLQHARIELQRVRIDGGHDAAGAERIEADDRLADVQFGAGPVALRQPFDAANHDVRPQPPHIAAEGLDGTVGGDQQRHDVEPVEALPRFEPRVGAGGLLHQRERVDAVPAMTFDVRPALAIERAVQADQSILPARGADAFRPAHADDAIARDAIRRDLGFGQRFSGQRFDWISPQLADVKGHDVLMPPTAGRDNFAACHTRAGRGISRVNTSMVTVFVQTECEMSEPTKHISCAQIMPGCPFTASAATEEELLQKVAVHAADAHGITEVTPELVEKVKAVIETR